MVPGPGHRILPASALGSLASVALSPSRHNQSIPHDATAQAPRRYPQSDKRSIAESGEADDLSSRRWGRRNGHAPSTKQLVNRWR
jgi:hypothetical protein